MCPASSHCMTCQASLGCAFQSHGFASGYGESECTCSFRIVCCCATLWLNVSTWARAKCYCQPETSTLGCLKFKEQTKVITFSSSICLSLSFDWSAPEEQAHPSKQLLWKKCVHRGCDTWTGPMNFLNFPLKMVQTVSIQKSHLHRTSFCMLRSHLSGLLKSSCSRSLIEFKIFHDTPYSLKTNPSPKHLLAIRKAIQTSAMHIEVNSDWSRLTHHSCGGSTMLNNCLCIRNYSFLNNSMGTQRFSVIYIHNSSPSALQSRKA